MRFRLRTLLIVLTIFCVWIGWLVRTATLQRQAIAWVKEEGGAVLYSHQVKADPLTSTISVLAENREAVEPAPEWAIDMLGMDYFDGVVAVQMDQCPVESIAMLERLPKTTQLHLGYTNVSDLTPIANLIQLKELYLSTSEVTDLSPLSKLTNLVWVDVSVTAVRDVSPLASSSNLRVLNLRYTQVSDVATLFRLKHLEWVDLSDTLVKESDYQALQRELPDCRIEWNANRLD